MARNGAGAHARKHKTATAVNVVAIVFCLAALLPALAIGVYDRPSADDFAYALQTHQAFQQTGGNVLAVLGAAVQTSADYYNSWQGLYSSAFLMALQPGLASSQLYFLGAFCIIAFLYAMCLYLAYCVERYALALPARFWPAAGCLLATLLVQCMPYANEGLYWFNGAVNYTPFVSAILGNVGLCIMALRAEAPLRRGVAVALAALVSFLVSGGNYMPAFFNLMLMVAFAGIGVMVRRPALFVPLATSIIGFAVSALAPGTAVRNTLLAEMGGHPGVLSTLLHSAYGMLLDLRVFVDLPVIVFLLAVTPLIVHWARRTQVGFSGKVLGLAFLACIVFMVGSLCVPYYAFGNFGEGRTRDAAYLIDLVLVVGLHGYAVCLLFTRFTELASWSDQVLSRLKVPAVCLLAALAVAVPCFYGSSIAGGGTSLNALRSLVSGEAQQFAAEYDAREALLLAGDGGVVTVGELTAHPQVLFFSDIVRNDDDWSQDMARYYGLESILVEHPAP